MITMARIIVGDCVSRMDMLEKESIDCILNDPPYEIGFMGKGWDNSGVAYSPRTWKACHRVLKPGGYMLNFGATRTHHRMIDAIERAGFEVVDVIAWCYGTGFPKSHNISKAIDKAAGAEREIIGLNPHQIGRKTDNMSGSFAGTTGDGYSGEVVGQRESFLTIPATTPAKQWEGWGTALKPAWEPIIVARKNTFGKSVSQKMNYQQFHYIPKAGKKERNRGLDDFEVKDKLDRMGGSAAHGNHNPVCLDCKKSKMERGNGICVCENPTMGCCPEKIGRIRDPQIRQRGGRIARGRRTNTNSRFSGRSQNNSKGKSKKR